MLRQVTVLALSFTLFGCGRHPVPSAPVLSAVDRNNLAVFLMEHERGDFPAAIDVLRRLTAEQPDYALAWLNLGIAHTADLSHEHRKTVAALDRAEQ